MTDYGKLTMYQPVQWEVGTDLQYPSCWSR